MTRRRPGPDWSHDSVSVKPNCRLTDQAVAGISKHLGLDDVGALRMTVEREMSNYLAWVNQDAAGGSRVRRSVALEQLIADLNRLTESASVLTVHFGGKSPSMAQVALPFASTWSASMILIELPDRLKDIASHLRRSNDQATRVLADSCLNIAGMLESHEQFGREFVGALGAFFPPKPSVTQSWTSISLFKRILTGVSLAATRLHKEEKVKGGPEAKLSLSLLVHRLASHYAKSTGEEFTHNPFSKLEYRQLSSKGDKLVRLILNRDSWDIEKKYRPLLPQPPDHQLATLLRGPVRGSKPNSIPDKHQVSVKPKADGKK